MLVADYEVIAVINDWQLRVTNKSGRMWLHAVHPADAGIDKPIKIGLALREKIPAVDEFEAVRKIIEFATTSSGRIHAD